MNPATLGKMMLGRASGDDILEMFSAMGMEMENRELPCNCMAVADEAEAMIHRGVASAGAFRLVTMKSRNGGTMTALVLIEEAAEGERGKRAPAKLGTLQPA